MAFIILNVIKEIMRLIINKNAFLMSPLNSEPLDSVRIRWQRRPVQLYNCLKRLSKLGVVVNCLGNNNDNDWLLCVFPLNTTMVLFSSEINLDFETRLGFIVRVREPGDFQRFQRYKTRSRLLLGKCSSSPRFWNFTLSVTRFNSNESSPENIIFTMQNTKRPLKCVYIRIKLKT